MIDAKIGEWLLTEDDRYLGRYLLFRARRGQMDLRLLPESFERLNQS